VHHDTHAPIDEDNNGVFFLNSRVRFKDVTDGVAYTIFLGEKDINSVTDLGWMSGTYATLRNLGQPMNSVTRWLDSGQATSPEEIDYSRFPTIDEAATPVEGEPVNPAFHLTGFGSDHTGDGAPFAFGDGRVRFLVQPVDLRVLQSLANRADGQRVELPPE
jgi:hypothetical protein